VIREQCPVEERVLAQTEVCATKREERSFLAALVRTKALVGNEERSLTPAGRPAEASGMQRKHSGQKSLIGFLDVPPSPLGFS